MSDIVKIIFQIIDEQKVKMAHIHEATGIHAATLRSWRTGEREPSLQKVEAVLDYLGYELEVLKR